MPCPTALSSTHAIHPAMAATMLSPTLVSTSTSILICVVVSRHHPRRHHVVVRHHQRRNPRCRPFMKGLMTTHHPLALSIPREPCQSSARPASSTDAWSILCPRRLRLVIRHHPRRYPATSSTACLDPRCLPHCRARQQTHIPHWRGGAMGGWRW
ncbi:hypothetical protein BJ912DRAFT_978802 [Pholiota molesta]|nr:hypothetical protein BJ912DRAFT_978802 [Pholiota molesta]